MNKKEVAFVATVRDFFSAHGRHTLPWRQTRDPYRILVSEVMLQQTQVNRVVLKYVQFTERFPTVHMLAQAPLRDVFALWQGLGYNRRAKMLHECAQAVVKEYGGHFPATRSELMSLPGIGPYTASAVLAFAFNEPTPLIETNVRSVYLYHFFKNKDQVADCELLPLVERTMDREHIREWYWALMDYGAFIKKTYGNPNAQSSHYARQSAFKDSDRQIRGSIIRALVAKRHTRASLLHTLRQFEDVRVDAQVQKLIAEKMIKQKGGAYQLP